MDAPDDLRKEREELDREWAKMMAEAEQGPFPQIMAVRLMEKYDELDKKIALANLMKDNGIRELSKLALSCRPRSTDPDHWLWDILEELEL